MNAVDPRLNDAASQTPTGAKAIQDGWLERRTHDR